MTATVEAAFELMKYGGIELKQNYRKYLGTALGIAAIVHLVFLIGFWVAQHWGEGDKGKVIPMVKMKLGDLAPPPSIQQNAQQPVSAAAPVARPSVGVPVPVPDAEVSPEQTFATLNEVAAPTGPVGDATGIGTGGVQIEEPLKVETDASEDPYAFTPVESEPQPTTDVRKNIVYPELARKAGIEGHVYLRFKVLKSGGVGEVIVEKSDHKILEDAAIEAIKKCKFTPAIQNGAPIDVWTSQTIDFRLK